MNNSVAIRFIEELLARIDIPDSAYRMAEERYGDLSEWFNRPQSGCFACSPHIYPQGSFRLGTVIRPIAADGEFDLDVGCRLRERITKTTHTQRQLKHLVGSDVAAYRTARNIRKREEEKRRCWRLQYAGDLEFHIDVVPSIPETQVRRRAIAESMMRAGAKTDLAALVAAHAGAITDNELWNYNVISDGWRISNSEGYALWFESRMKLAPALLTERARRESKTRVEDLPVYRWKSPLQATVQILKRHRDAMFANAPAGAPISVIITTLAGAAYAGETTVASAMVRVLAEMDRFIGATQPRVPNPVNPEEDFADKWADPRYSPLNLEGNFRRWLAQLRRDFAGLDSPRDTGSLVELAKSRFGVPFDPAELGQRVGLGALLAPPATPGNLSFPAKPIIPNKPGGFA